MPIWLDGCYEDKSRSQTARYLPPKHLEDVLLSLEKLGALTYRADIALVL